MSNRQPVTATPFWRTPLFWGLALALSPCWCPILWIAVAILTTISTPVLIIALVLLPFLLFLRKPRRARGRR